MALTPNTLSLQRTRVRFYLQEPTAQFWTDALLNMYINESQFAIACGIIPGLATGMLEPILPSEAYCDAVASQELYSLPPNFHGVRTVRVRSTATEDYSELPSTDIEYARAHPRSAAVKPSAYFLWGESGTYQIGMYPAFTSSSGNAGVGASTDPRLYVTYWRKPTELTADGDTLQIPAELHVANALLAGHRAWFERGHATEAKEALGLFTAEYQGALAYIRQRLVNQDRAVTLGSLGDDDTDRTLM